jgi:hypothetical protein
MDKILSSFEHDGLKVTLECTEHNISQILQAFHNVLRGAGFSPMGELEYVDSENITDEKEGDVR